METVKGPGYGLRGGEEIGERMHGSVVRLLEIVRDRSADVWFRGRNGDPMGDVM